jgi:uncharacterized protein YoaH (UPF0181 family)
MLLQKCYQILLMGKNKPFTRSEMKILVYNKMKSGLSYDEAIKQISKEVDYVVNNKKELRREQKDNKKIDKKFKEDFTNLKNEK